MDKIIQLGNLYDIYGDLLTPRQQAIVEQYAYEDCSLSEISEREHISRQAVCDCINKAENVMNVYEQALHLMEKDRQYGLKIKEIFNIVNSNKTDGDKVECIRNICSDWMDVNN